MNEKMTDEDVALYQQIAAGDVAVNEDLLMEWTVKAAAHIAALTTERDEALKDAEVSDATARSNVAELDALRERVQALEAELQGRKEVSAALNRSNAEMGDSLAAIRQRAKDETTLVRRAEIGAIMGASSSVWDEEIHAEVVQRGDAETLRGAALAVARHILGDDSRPRAPPEAFTHEKGLDAGVFDDDRAPTPPAVVAAARNAVGLPPLPTTSEAFATVRDGLEGRLLPETAHAALTLLERRMGAMEKAMRRVLSDCRCTKEGPTPELCVFCAALCDAITDAPPVFTLEADEVEEKARDVYEAAIARREHQPTALSLAIREAIRLTALRRTP